MLKRFYADNFKTLINVEWLPTNINLVVGPNNTGKTNLCNALAFLSLTTQGPMKDIAPLVGEPWQLHNAFLMKPTIELECTAELAVGDVPHIFEYSLSLEVTWPQRPQTGGGVEYSVGSEKLSVTPAGAESADLLVNERGTVRLLHEGRYFDGVPGDPYIETRAPHEATMLFRLYEIETNRLANAFKKYLQSWRYFSPNPHAIRSGTASKPADWLLAPNAENLASVLYTLKNQSEPFYRQIVELMKELEPELDSIGFHSPQQDQVYMWFSDGRRRFTTMAMSDGTLRFLTLACVLVSTKMLTETLHIPPPLLMFEEPENGLYVGHLRRMFALIDVAGRHGQYVFTSQSPYLIDLFDKALEGVRVARRRQTHTELRAPNPEHIRSVLEEMSLGELHFREMWFEDRVRS